jgi:membrane protease YdiL (CAAX protease family)
VAGNLSGLPVKSEPDPDNPPWNSGVAFLTWLGSVALLFGMSAASLVIILPYFSSKYGTLDKEQLRQLLMTDPLAVLLQVIAVIPAHLLTLVLAWAVVTNFGRRPFWQTLGWRWNRGMEWWSCIAIAIGLLLLGGVITYNSEGKPTDIDQIINNSTASRFVLAFLATATAPIVEELIYRGILYSALQRAIGVAWSVIAVTILFASVHVAQYYNNLSVIVTIGILSLTLTLVRAYSKSLLPCFAIHLVFNGLQSVFIILQPYVKWLNTPPPPQPQPGIFAMLAQLFGVNLF